MGILERDGKSGGSSSLLIQNSRTRLKFEAEVIIHVSVPLTQTHLGESV